MKYWNQLFVILTLCVFAGFVAHAYAIIDPTSIPNQSLGEHIFWVIADLSACYFILNRHKYFLVILTIWLIQQWYFHGGIALDLWRTEEVLAYSDISVVIFMPILFVCYAIDVFYIKESIQYN